MPIIIAIALGISVMAGAGYTATHHNLNSQIKHEFNLNASTTPEQSDDDENFGSFVSSLAKMLHLKSDVKDHDKNDKEKKEHSTNASTTAEMHANANSRVMTASTTEKTHLNLNSESSLDLDLR